MDKFLSARKSEKQVDKNCKKEIFDKVKLDELPRFADLKDKVDQLISKSTWWDLYGVDWLILGIFLAGFFASLLIMQSDSWIPLVVGTFILGWMHCAFTVKGAHLACHGGLTSDQTMQRLLSRFMIEFCGQFSEELAYDIHIKEHHPYTNIIGRGDSSTWKAPFVPRYLYMFVTPWLIPVLHPIVSVVGLVQKRALIGLISYFLVSISGFATAVYLLMTVSKFSCGGALLCIYLSRGMFSIPYLHVNIFQHIGLPMFCEKSKPARIYQMASGVLNLPWNIVLSYAFGHSIISCHVEHHLFPRLSDNMCLRIQPVVSKFLKEKGLPYHEDTYMGRLKYFLDQYERLMVNAPPITHFVGIQ